ncbi:S1 family peptidase [Amycolatopsis cihanbeyliensis]|uniref:Trypsin n=1 Tax=Amycolatopsis cihanbeyliensis TaxID=1128664 RepID=A0A542CSF4_AMYCI|nr:S1 family peptidase [Amycolatopsis cihanbeyliensis]TQI93751.1 trypsin [Amycolatopsis cihanbeyliensis]
MTRRMTPFRLVAAAALALTATSGLTATSAVAEPELSQGLAAAMQRDLGLTEQQARTRLAREADAARQAPAAREAAGGAFGGSWFDPDKGTLVVGLTDPARAEAVRATGAQPVPVSTSAAELDTAKAAIDALAPAPEGVSSWHADHRSGKVVLNVRAGASGPRLDDFLAAAREAGPVTVRTAPTAEAPRTFAAGVVGGDPYYINGNTRCSIGFAVHGGFVSAGHCGGAGSSVVGWDGSTMGHFAGSSFPGNDYSFIRTGHGWWTVPVVLGWGTEPDRLVRGSWEAPVGSSVCRSGSTTHWHCGTVLAKNETVNYEQGAFHGATKTSVCAEPGDSGGSFITGDQAQGVTSGGWGNCSSGGQTWFQPVNEILSAYNLQLHTA